MVRRFKHRFYTWYLPIWNSKADKYNYSYHGIGFNSHSQFSWSDRSKEKKVIIFVVLSWYFSVHIDGRNKNILVLGEGPTQGLDNTTITEDKYLISFAESGKRFVLK